MTSKSHRLAIVAAASTAILAVQPALAETAARVARTNISIAESLQVRFETDQKVSDEPDFSALNDDFEILASSKSTSLNIVNGDIQRNASWVLQLMPKREGELIIPPIKIGDEMSDAVGISVAAQFSGSEDSPADDISLEVDVDTFTPYVQGQLIYTVRVVHAVAFDQASLPNPSVSNGDAVIEKLGDDVSYEAKRGEKRVGIIERRYAIFPQTSEPMTIEPLRFEGRIAGGRQFRYDPFSRGRVIRKLTDAVEIDPQQVPTDFSGSTWLPASQVMLVETSPQSNAEYRVGEPITRELTLQATGLTASQLPEIPASAPSSVKQYPDQPVLENRVSNEGMVGIRKETIALIPSQAGSVTLAAIQIPWWNTASNQMEYASLPARTIQVEPATGGNNSAISSGPVTADSQLGTPESSSIRNSGNQIASSADVAVSNTNKATSDGSKNFWPWISMALALGWLATLFVWRNNGKRQITTTTDINSRTTEKQLLAKLKTACESNDADAAKSLLLQWAELRWPGNRIRSLGEMAAQFDGDLQGQLLQLSQHLYAQSDSEWHGKTLWQKFVDRPQTLAVSKVAEPDLQPLYK